MVFLLKVLKIVAKLFEPKAPYQAMTKITIKVIIIVEIYIGSRNSPGILLSDQNLSDLPDGKIIESSALSSVCPGSPPGGF